MPQSQTVSYSVSIGRPLRPKVGMDFRQNQPEQVMLRLDFSVLSQLRMEKSGEQTYLSTGEVDSDRIRKLRYAVMNPIGELLGDLQMHS